MVSSIFIQKSKGFKRLTRLIRPFEDEPKYQRLLLLGLAFVLVAFAQVASVSWAGDSPGQLSGPGNRPDAHGETSTAKAINGVSYSNLYNGATLDVRANACIKDAETGRTGTRVISVIPAPREERRQSQLRLWSVIPPVTMSHGCFQKTAHGMRRTRLDRPTRRYSNINSHISWVLLQTQPDVT